MIEWNEWMDEMNEWRSGWNEWMMNGWNEWMNEWMDRMIEWMKFLVLFSPWFFILKSSHWINWLMLSGSVKFGEFSYILGCTLELIIMCGWQLET
jgi:hypothetical protein